jgi:magnesium transporter
MWAYALDITEPSSQRIDWLTLEQVLARPLSEATWVHLDGSADPPTTMATLRTHLKPRVPRHQLQRFFKLPVSTDPGSGPVRPSLDEHDQGLFIRFLVPQNSQNQTNLSQVHVLVVNQWLITMVNQALPSLEAFQKSLKRGITSWHTLGSIGLAAELLDTLVDQYALVLNHVDEDLMNLEHHIQQGHRKLEPKLFHLQRHILQLRHTAFQHQEVCYWLCNRDIALIDQAPNPDLVSNAYRRLYDHMSRISNWCEFARDSLTGSITIYLGLIANQTNEVMRTLTLMTILFMPPTLIAGIYGMNFEVLPELHWRWGYPMAIGLMLLSNVILWRYFSNKKLI